MKRNYILFYFVMKIRFMLFSLMAWLFKPVFCVSYESKEQIKVIVLLPPPLKNSKLCRPVKIFSISLCFSMKMKSKHVKLWKMYVLFWYLFFAAPKKKHIMTAGGWQRIKATWTLPYGLSPALPRARCLNSALFCNLALTQISILLAPGDTEGDCCHT